MNLSILLWEINSKYLSFSEWHPYSSINLHTNSEQKVNETYRAYNAKIIDNKIRIFFFFISTFQISIHYAQHKHHELEENKSSFMEYGSIIPNFPLVKLKAKGTSSTKIQQTRNIERYAQTHLQNSGSPERKNSSQNNGT